MLVEGPVSRIRLSKLTGLTKMAVTNIINELLEEGIVQEVGVQMDVSLGRRPVNLDIVPGCKLYLGLYISRNYLYAVVGDIKGTIFLEGRTALLDETNESLLEKTFRLCDRMLKKKSGIQSIGISCIGPLDAAKGVILNPPNFYHVADLPIVQSLEERYRLPVYLEKDMNTSVLAEKYFGKAKDIADFIYIGVTNGIGAGMMFDNKLYTGERGFGGEFGHICVDPGGKRCSCGNRGCLEMYASVPREGKMDVETACHYLAVGVTTLINLFDPKRIYIGHDIARLRNKPVRLLKEYISQNYISRDFKDIPIELSAFGDKSPIHGALALCVASYLGI